MAQDPDADMTLLHRQPFDVAAITIKPEGSPTWQWYMIRDGEGRKIARLRVWPNGKRQVQCHKKLTPAEMFAVAVAAERFERVGTELTAEDGVWPVELRSAMRTIEDAIHDAYGGRPLGPTTPITDAFMQLKSYMRRARAVLGK